MGEAKLCAILGHRFLSPPYRVPRRPETYPVTLDPSGVTRMTKNSFDTFQRCNRCGGVFKSYAEETDHA